MMSASTRSDDDYNAHDDVPQFTPDDEAMPEDAMDDVDLDNGLNIGTVMEAAFVDPAYQWPPPDGQGKNAIELKASQSLMADLEDPTMEFNKETQSFVKKPAMAPGQRGVRTTKTLVEDSSYRGFWCCKWDVKNQVAENIQEDPFEVDEHGNVVPLPERAAGTNASMAASRSAGAAADEEQAREEAAREDKQEQKEARYGKVPEGILIYRLNTQTRRIELLSKPHSNTDMDTLVRDMVIKKVSPSNDSSRRGMNLVGKDGTKATLVACEQRTAIAWLEVIEMALGQKSNKMVRFSIIIIFVVSLDIWIFS